MSNLVEWITEMAAEEQIESVVIGEMGWGDYGSEAIPNYSEQPRGKTIPWSEAQKFLKYDFDSGYGAPGCNAVYVWTSTKILFVWQYDGATSMCAIPRNPVDCMPEMPGG